MVSEEASEITWPLWTYSMNSTPLESPLTFSTRATPRGSAAADPNSVAPTTTTRLAVRMRELIAITCGGLSLISVYGGESPRPCDRHHKKVDYLACRRLYQSNRSRSFFMQFRWRKMASRFSDASGVRSGV